MDEKYRSFPVSKDCTEIDLTATYRYQQKARDSKNSRFCDKREL